MKTLEKIITGIGEIISKPRKALCVGLTALALAMPLREAKASTDYIKGFVETNITSELPGEQMGPTITKIQGKPQVNYTDYPGEPNNPNVRAWNQEEGNYTIDDSIGYQWGSWQIDDITFYLDGGMDCTNSNIYAKDSSGYHIIDDSPGYQTGVVAVKKGNDIVIGYMTKEAGDWRMARMTFPNGDLTAGVKEILNKSGDQVYPHINKNGDMVSEDWPAGYRNGDSNVIGWKYGQNDSYSVDDSSGRQLDPVIADDGTITHSTFESGTYWEIAVCEEGICEGENKTIFYEPNRHLKYSYIHSDGQKIKRMIYQSCVNATDAFCEINMHDFNTNNWYSINDNGYLAKIYEDSIVFEHSGGQRKVYMSEILFHGDINLDKEQNLIDYAIFAGHYKESGCIAPDFCDGADINRDGNVDLEDLANLNYLRR